MSMLILSARRDRFSNIPGATTATSGAITYNEGDCLNWLIWKIAHLGGSNCHFADGGSAPAAEVQQAPLLYIGGTNGESGLVLNNMGGIYTGNCALGSIEYFYGNDQ